MNNAQIIKALRGGNNLKKQLAVEERRLKKLNEKVERLRHTIQEIAPVTDVIDGIALNIKDWKSVDNRRIYEVRAIGGDYRRWVYAYDCANSPHIGINYRFYPTAGMTTSDGGGTVVFVDDWATAIQFSHDWVIRGEKKSRMSS